MRWRILLVLIVVGAMPQAVEAQPGRPRQDDRVRVQAEGNELTASRTAPVSYSTLEQFTAEIERPLPPRSDAFRLVRASPPQMITYVLCITREGTLVLGQQIFDLAQGRPSFSLGEIARAYARLPRPGPWTWLVDVPVSREAHATLELQATALEWPVRSVTIKVNSTR